MNYSHSLPERVSLRAAGRGEILEKKRLYIMG